MPWHNFCLALILLFFTSTPLKAELFASTPQKDELIIGVLANRDNLAEYEKYKVLADALSKKAPYEYKISIIDFEDIEDEIKQEKIDFLIANPSLYVMFEAQLGIMRIATLQNFHCEDRSISKFGGVIFTSSKNDFIYDIEDVKKAKDSKIVAVDKNSLGGYIALRYELLKKYGIDIQSRVEFLGNHDEVVRHVLFHPNDIGIVRTDIIEQMADKGTFDIEQIRPLISKNYPCFPFIISTELYPEWAFAAMPATSLELAKKTLVYLLDLNKSESEIIWTIPLDYNVIHKVHKFLKLPPYDAPISLKSFIATYKTQIIFMLIGSILTLILLIRLIITNKKYNHINANLNRIVHEKTRALKRVNEYLKTLVDTDDLTRIASRRYFFDHSRSYLQLSLRNRVPFFILSLDIDYFKRVNDTYGHDVGDMVLSFFCEQVAECLRKTDIFGRIGGEEFGICTIDTNKDGVIKLAEKIRSHVEKSAFKFDDISINITVSIGIAGAKENEKCIEPILRRADKALYEAKSTGRNRIAIN